MVLTGDHEIDFVRREVRASPTTPATFGRRMEILYSWCRLLQRLGHDGSVLEPLHESHLRGGKTGNPAVLAAVDKGFAILEDLASRGEVVREIKGQASASGVDESDWPHFHNDAGQTGVTSASGPTDGGVAWRAAAGLRWKAAPVAKDGRVYVASPGMRHHAICFDLDTGDEVWRARRPMTEDDSPIMHPYGKPAAASTPILLDDEVLVREIGSGGPAAHKHLLGFSREDGSFLRRIDVGHVDYRLGTAVAVGNEDVFVTLAGTQHIQHRPPLTRPMERVEAWNATSGERRWSTFVGSIDTEPLLLIEQRLVIAATRDGELLGIELADGSTRWRHRLRAAANQPSHCGEGIVVGSNDGCVSLVSNDGETRWTVSVCPPEPHASLLFSKPHVEGDTVLVGSSGPGLAGALFAIDLASGTTRWQQKTEGWLRSRPFVVGGVVVCVDWNGVGYGFDLVTGKELWRKQISTHAILADLAAGEDLVAAVSSDLRLHVFDATTGQVRFVKQLIAGVTADVGRGVEFVPSDSFGGGGYYQSGPTVRDGRVYLGGPDACLKSYDAASGKLCWRFEVGSAISSHPHVTSVDDRAVVLFGQQGGDDTFFALDAETGDEIWRQTVGWCWSSPNVAGDVVLVPTVDGDIFGLDLRTGFARWRFRTGAACHPMPPTDGEVAYFGSWNGLTYALNVTDGSLIWKNGTDGAPDSGAPVLDGGELTLTNMGSTLIALDAATGVLKWRRAVAKGRRLNSTPAVTKDRIWISDGVWPSASGLAAETHCLERRTGRLLWSTDGGALTSPIVDGEGRMVVASTADCFVRCVDSEGNVVWRTRLGDTVDEAVPAIAGGRLFVAASDGWLYAIGGSVGRNPEESA
ncbi:MAG: PQQ-binding-like beta-propeller repeat protein [Planctomycetota bacterium]